MSSYKAGLRSAGYKWLIEKLDLTVIPNWHESYVSSSTSHKSDKDSGIRVDIYPGKYWPGDSVQNHLEFALKYDGTNLAILFKIFEAIDPDILTDYINSKPTGKYSRRLWFFYEFLTQKLLPLSDMKTGNYVDALDGSQYYVLEKGERSTRHRVNNNLLGNSSFCPVVRKTGELIELGGYDLNSNLNKAVSAYSPRLVKRAMGYFYRKETRSSFEIEKSTPDPSRTEKFVAVLKLAQNRDFCNKEAFIELQNLIVDERFKDYDFRVSQNYIGQSTYNDEDVIHYVSPKPEDLPSLMEGLIETNIKLNTSEFPAVIHAAVLSWSFVYLHPFEDGNGRIHRFLIHNVLARKSGLPSGTSLPVSSIMIKDATAYDSSLEAFSEPLLKVLDYSIDKAGKMSVHGQTSCWYRYLDLTTQATALYHFLIKTIEEELVQEMEYLQARDYASTSLSLIVDMPDRLMDLFIKLCLQNKGDLSQNKRKAHFSFLTDKELQDMEQAVKLAFGLVLNESDEIS